MAFFGPTLVADPICRPYRPLRPLPSSSLTQPSGPIPASLHLPQGRFLSQPFLDLRHRWQRGMADRSSPVPLSPPFAKLIVDARECLRECADMEVGEMNPVGLVVESVMIFDFLMGGGLLVFPDFFIVVPFTLMLDGLERDFALTTWS